MAKIIKGFIEGVVEGVVEGVNQRVNQGVSSRELTREFRFLWLWVKIGLILAIQPGPVTCAFNGSQWLPGGYLQKH